MNYSDYIYPVLLFSVAVLAALSLAFTQGIFFEVERKFSAATMALVPILMCAGLAVGTLFSGRNLDYAEGAMANGGSSLQRAATVLIIAICVAKIVNSYWILARREFDISRFSVAAGFLALFLVTNVISPVFNQDGGIVHNSFYPIAVLLALYRCQANDFDAAVGGLRLGLLLLASGGIALAFFKPEMALQATAGVTIPGIKFRLWGLGAHANGAGAVGLILLLVLYFRPFESVKYNILSAIVGILMFVLAQSKTMWVAGVLVGIVLGYYRVGRDSQGRIKPLFVVFLLLVATCLIAWVSTIDIDRLLRLLFADREISQLATATGRVDIWRVAMQIWIDNFWIGYGPDAWGPLQRLKIGMPYALHAHNQLLQVLTVSGAIGGVCLVAYVTIMARSSFALSLQTRGVSVAVLLYMLLRSITEVPLAVRGLFNEDIVIHLFWLILVLAPISQTRIKGVTVGLKRI